MEEIMGLLTAVFLLAFLASTQSFGQQEGRDKYIIIEKRVPDSTIRQFFAPKTDPARIRRGWGKLKRGMLEKDVEALLGKPTGIRVDDMDNCTTWYYEERWVRFDTINRTMREWWK